jgi:hypothetical protein
MRWKQIEDEAKFFALVFETGDEIASVLQLFSKNQGLAEAVSPAIPKALHPSAYYPAVSPVVMVQGCFSDGPEEMK